MDITTQNDKDTIYPLKLVADEARNDVAYMDEVPEVETKVGDQWGVITKMIGDDNRVKKDKVKGKVNKPMLNTIPRFLLFHEDGRRNKKKGSITSICRCLKKILLIFIL